MNDPVDDLIAQFAQALYGAHGSLQPQLAKEAAVVVPLLRDAMEDEVPFKAANAPAAYSWLMGTFDADETADKLHAITAEEIGSVVDKVLMQRPAAEELARRMLTLPEEDHIAFTAAIDAVLPAGLQAAERAARGGLSLGQDVREARELALSLPDGAVAAAFARQQENSSRAQVIDSLYNFLQEITPDQLRRFHRYLDQNLEGAQIGLFVRRSAETTLEIFEAAAAGNYLRPAHPAKVKAFGRTLHEILTVIEDGLADANITVPVVVRAVLIDQLDTTKLLRAAKTLADSNAAEHGVTRKVPVGKPLRFKTPKP